MPTTRPRLVRALTLAFALAGVSACASGSSGGTARGPADRITPAELEQWASQDLYTLVQRLRPRWLQNRAPTTAQGRATIAVMVDGVRQQGSLEALRSMRAQDVQELSFMNARDATTRFGTDMTAGAILVVTKR